ncbi:MAG: YlbF family regulator [Chloroflexota bacterium]|uniref:YlbF family regulator n=1 Tax=Bellilinea sp. TaxID=2838785 RepID=UPI002ADDA6F0|nr:YlbF family regulator [Bellilinea sp.]
MEPYNELELTPTSVVLESARQYAGVFKSTPQYQNFVNAYNRFLGDETAQQTLYQLRQKQEEVRNQRLSSPVSEADQAEIKRLEQIFYEQPSVKHYLEAQNDLLALAQNQGDTLSEALGLDFAAVCRRGGCCG